MRRVAAMLAILAIAAAACGGGDDDPRTVQTPLLLAESCRQVELAMATAAGGGATQTGSTPEPEEAIATLRAAAAEAPAAIKADIELVANALQAYFDALADAGVDLGDPSTIQNNPEAAQAAGRAATQFGMSGAPAAVQRVRDYFKQICPRAS